MAKGSTMLKVVGILMIVFGAISTIITLIALVGVSVVASALSAGGLYVFGVILAFLGSVAELVTGILGVVNCDKVEKAQMLLICAIIIVALSFLGNLIFPLIAGGSPSIFSFLIGLILPGLFAFGAIQNKQG